VTRSRLTALGMAVVATTAVGLSTLGAAPPAIAQTTIAQATIAQATIAQATVAQAAAGVAEPVAAGGVPQVAEAVPADSPLRATPATMQLAGYVGALQPNGWYCGPAATRIALSAHGIVPSFDDIAAALGTTRNGTASIFEVSRVLNNIYGWQRYTSVEVPGGDITGNQVKSLREDVVTAINDGDPVVANIKGTITDFAGEVHSYPGGHYVTITGYSDNGDTVTVTDPADRVGSNEYQVSAATMLWWTASRGYTA